VRKPLAAVFFAIAGLLFFSTGTHPASSDLLAANAAEAYAEGRYAESLSLYKKLAASGCDGAQVRYDIGNCRLKQGDIGRAILAYRRALKFDSGMEAALHNLEVARKLLKARAAAWEPSPWEAFVRGVPLLYMEIALLLLTLFGNILLCAALILDPGRARRLCVQFMIAFFLIAGATMGVKVYAKGVRASHKPAVVVESAGIFESPVEKGKPLATLPAGSEIIEVQRAGGWCFVLWGEGRGWTRSSSVEIP